MFNFGFNAAAGMRQGNARAFISRSTPATYIDQNGILQTAAPNVPRYQNGSLLVEAAATNLLELTTNQSFIDTSTIYKSTSSLGNADGAVALTCVANGASRPFGSWGGVPVAAGAVVTSSVWVESLSSAEAVNQILSWQGDFGSTRTWYLNGVALPGGNTLIGPFGFPVKLSCSLIGDVGGNPSLFVRSGIGCSSLTTAKQARISRPQLETGTVPTSYIPTTTAPVTRTADVVAFV